MLDSTVILQDVEELLNDHFSNLQAAWQQPNQQTHRAIAPTTHPTTAITPIANPVTEFVTNVIMLLMFSALEKRLPS